MPKLIISNVPGLDGEYELDLAFSHRDFRTIKQIAGVRANEVMDAIEAGDLDIIVALAEIAITRTGKPHSIEQLWDSTAGSIVFDVEDLEDDAAPPPIVNAGGSADASETSGVSTSNGSDSFPENGTPVSVGMPPSDTSAIWDQPISTD